MSRYLRMFLLGCIALAFGYLVVHSREALRLNIGDPWSDANVLSSINYVKQYGFIATSFTDILDVGPLTPDSYRYIHYPPLSEIIYGAIGRYLGASDIATFRLFGIAFSGLAMWLLFLYVKRMYNDTVAVIATALFMTSFFWLQYADSMHQAPVMQASGFLALWGLVRAIETRQRRHYAAAIIGSFACFLTSYDYWLFLPAGVLVTVWLKLGNPFARGRFHFVALCAAGCILAVVAKCLAVIGAVGWTEFLADLHLQFLERATSTHDRKFTSGGIPTMFRRITLVFTPFAWITAGYHVWRAVRAPTLTAALKETAIWMLLVALAFLYVFGQLAASQMLASQVLLPFYAIGSAIVINSWLDGSQIFRKIAIGWLVIAPLWSFYFMFTHPRSVLDRDDVAKVNSYLAQHDRNDFVMSNLMSDGHIQASFEKHYWAALDASDTTQAHLHMLRVFELAGTDYVHAVIFNTPDSRFIDKSLWPLAMPRRFWSLTGWPHLHRAKANKLIGEYDKNVLENLTALDAKKVLELSNFAVYRLDRATVMEIAGRRVPVVPRIDFGAIESNRHKLLGWSGQWLTEDTGMGVASVAGYFPCPKPAQPPRAGEPRGNACKTILTKFGLKMKDEAPSWRAQLMVRIERACDLRMTLRFSSPALLGMSINDFKTSQQVPGKQVSFLVPQRSVRAGINIITFENLFGWMVSTTDISSLAIDPICGPP